MKKISIIIVSLLFTSFSFALETPMNKLSKYFKKGIDKNSIIYCARLVKSI
tara:strand:- start:166 stop:318 length:153 start_codon:yes stop_codon:yes gene_type:complete